MRLRDNHHSVAAFHGGASIIVWLYCAAFVRTAAGLPHA
jgi:hypothetical protein